MGSYDQHILRVLTAAGQDGLSVAKISKHVFNEANTFFSTLNLEETHREVANFLLRNSKFPGSLVEKTSRGIYRLNPRSAETAQLMLQFREEEQKEEEKKSPDLSLSLFADI